MTEDFLRKKLEEREQQNSFRQLRLPTGKTDFCSNDYVGMVKNDLVNLSLGQAGLLQHKSGSTGSRLISGNYALVEETEKAIAAFHEAEAGLLFNSGYDANIGLLGCIAQRGDTIIYDALSHASLRDGIRLSYAQSFSFRHNDLADLEAKLGRATGNIFVVTESVFSMDGDKAPLAEIVSLCERCHANLIVDEAHATGVVGSRGEGLVQLLGLQQRCFARIHTFGKACGVHGAIILGTEQLRNYLINFSRSFIYTTALPEASVLAIKTSYEIFPKLYDERSRLHELIKQFQQSVISHEILTSDTPIQVVIVPGNDAVKKLASKLQEQGMDVRPILYPTVPKGRERLRIVLHSFNSSEELAGLAGALRWEV